jgi:hypothetical protein
LALTVLLFLGGLLWAFRNPNKSRTRFGAYQWIGLALCALGLFVWLGTLAFPFTWGWWL